MTVSKKQTLAAQGHLGRKPEGTNSDLLGQGTLGS